MESKQFDARNLAMVMDFYEMTMSNGYFEHWKRDGAAKTARVAFDVFYRKNPDNGGFAIFAGLEQVLDYIETLHFDNFFQRSFLIIWAVSILRGMSIHSRREPLCIRMSRC